MTMVSGFDVLATLIVAVLILLVGSLQAGMLKIGFVARFICIIGSFVIGYSRYLSELATPADPVSYYIDSLSQTQFQLGTEFISYITSYISIGLGLGFLPTMMAFTIFSMLALQLFYATLLRATDGELPPIWLAAFLILVTPSVAFWGAGIGKDGIALLGVALYCWALTPQRPSVFLLIVGVALMMLVRPHIGLVMMGALVVATLLGRNIGTAARFSITTGSVLAAAAVIPFVIVYIGLGDIENLSDVSYRLDTIALGYEGTASYVDVTELPLPLKLFTYGFRPLPWEAASLTQWAAALQNLILLGWVAWMGPSLFRSAAEIRSFRQMAWLGMGVAGFVLLAYTTSNLGMAARQKWMVVLPLIIAMARAWSLSRRRFGGGLAASPPISSQSPLPLGPASQTCGDR